MKQNEMKKKQLLVFAGFILSGLVGGMIMDFDQQPMMKKGAKVVCFGSCAVAAPSVTSALMDFTSTSGCLLL